MLEKRIHFEEGQLVTFSPFAKDLQTYPYKTCRYDRDRVFVLYEKIDMFSYPSWNDFKGGSVKARSGETGILMGAVGIPQGLQLFSLDWPDLDLCVYKVLLNGRQVQVFGIDLS